MDKDTEKLLIEIKNAVLCQYLSDLHSANTLFDTRAKRLVYEIPDHRYSSIEWTEAVRYIIGKPYSFTTVLDAKNAIVEK